MSSSIRRVALAAGFGTTLEWYDFFLYGTASALIFPELFFPQDNPVTGTLFSFGVYAVGFIARPLGGILFGHFGDRVGRRTVLVITLMLMGGASTLIGLLPTYSQLGMAAPILLIALRILQGVGVGGEWGGAAILTREHADGRTGFWGSLLSSAIYLGMVLGSTAFAVLAIVLSDEALQSWGWRIPFLLSFVLLVAGFLIRRHIPETPEFREVKKSGARSRMPLLEALRSPRNLLAIFFMRIGQNASFYVVSVFALVYATDELGLPESLILVATVVGASVACVMAPVWGHFGDRFGFRRMIAISMVFQIVFAVPFFLLLETRETVVVIAAVTVGIAGGAAVNDAIQPALFTSLFGTRVRYSGVSLGREGGTLVGGGLTPLIATGLMTWAGSPWAVAGFMAFTSLCGCAAVFLARPVAEDGVQLGVTAPRRWPAEEKTTKGAQV